MVDMLGECGIGRRRITVVVPSHEAQLDGSALTGGYADVELVTIAAQDSYKHRLLAGLQTGLQTGLQPSDTPRPLIEQLVSGECFGAQVIDDGATNAINRRLSSTPVR